jgi:hypothetical protein
MAIVLLTSLDDLLRFELLHRDDNRILLWNMLLDETQRMVDSTDAQQAIVFGFRVTTQSNFIKHYSLNVGGDFNNYLKTLQNDKALLSTNVHSSCRFITCDKR